MKGRRLILDYFDDMSVDQREMRFDYEIVGNETPLDVDRMHTPIRKFVFWGIHVKAVAAKYHLPIRNDQFRPYIQDIWE
jgi:hypothetical protein